MRADEFITEEKKGKLRKGHASAMPGAIKFRDEGVDRIYNLNRIMMAAAMSDGSSTAPLEMDSSSWAEKFNTAHPYTELEHKMMQQAFATIDSNHHEVISDHRSKEREDTHKISPHLPFKGYPR